MFPFIFLRTNSYRKKFQHKHKTVFAQDIGSCQTFQTSWNEALTVYRVKNRRAIGRIPINLYSHVHIFIKTEP